jgi:tryptophan synthase alpha chain
VTGASNLNLDDVRSKLEEIRSHTHLPVGVGFGVKDAVTAAAVAGLADGVVVGSALVSRIEAHPADSEQALAEIVALLAQMRAAVDAPR